jgi:hypothetical protein
MPIEPSLPIAIWQYERWFPWPLVWEVSVDWSFSVDGELIEEGDGFTDTSTITGSGSGNVVISLDPVRAPLSGVQNANAEKFLVTKRLTLDPADAEAFKLFCSSSAEAGTFSVTETLLTEFVDPEQENIETVVPTEGDAIVSGLEISIGPETVSIDSVALFSAESSALIPYWLPSESWSFDRADLFLPQTQTLTRTAAEIGYDTGTGWEQSVTIQLTSYADRPL